MTKYTFILTAYRGRFLREAIDSILAQTYTDYRLVIVDDASPDDLRSIVDSYDDARITFHRHDTNTGGANLSQHWNNCLAYADTEYIILASDDDTYDPEFLRQVDVLTQRYPQCDVIQARVRYPDVDNRICGVSPPLREYLTAAEYCNMYMSGVVMSSLQNHVFRLSSLLRAGGFVNLPLAWHSDDATVLLMSTNGVAITRDVLFTFRNSGYNISSINNDPAIIEQKLMARAKFADWVSDTYIPLTQSWGLTGPDDLFMVSDIEPRLSRRVRSDIDYVFYATSVGNLLRCRRPVCRCYGLSRPRFAYRMLRKCVKNYRFLFRAETWTRYISRMLHR